MACLAQVQGLLLLLRLRLQILGPHAFDLVALQPHEPPPLLLVPPLADPALPVETRRVEPLEHDGVPDVKLDAAPGGLEGDRHRGGRGRPCAVDPLPAQHVVATTQRSCGLLVSKVAVATATDQWSRTVGRWRWRPNACDLQGLLAVVLGLLLQGGVVHALGDAGAEQVLQLHAEVHVVCAAAEQGPHLGHGELLHGGQRGLRPGGLAGDEVDPVVPSSVLGGPPRDPPLWRWPDDLRLLRLWRRLWRGRLVRGGLRRSDRCNSCSLSGLVLLVEVLARGGHLTPDVIAELLLCALILPLDEPRRGLALVVLQP
mmetsp:Transcript_146096/g.370872  ORF Transcript_146096/g.370872 Transcript_146096/m.370872 type:complete len:314 (-) Transcript_146096:170-1111(-)